MDFSIVVPLCNEADYLEECLTALSMQRLPSDRYEVIVVDNGSTDASLAILERWPDVRVLHEPKSDPYLARNRGIEASRGRIIAFTDADCRVQSDWLERLQGAFDDGADLVVGRIDYPEECSFWLRLYKEYYDAKTKWIFEAGIQECFYGHGGNMAVRVEVFDRVGLFRPMPCVGDTELLHRIIAYREEVDIRYAEDVEVTHLEVATLQDMLPKLERYGEYATAVSAKARYRPLSMRERLGVMWRCVAANRYGALRIVGLGLVLSIGFARFENGRRAALREAAVY